MLDNNKTEYIADGSYIKLSDVGTQLLDWHRQFISPNIISLEEWEKAKLDR